MAVAQSSGGFLLSPFLISHVSHTYTLFSIPCHMSRLVQPLAIIIFLNYWSSHPVTIEKLRTLSEMGI